MKNKFIHIIVTAVTLLSFPNINFGQAPTLDTASSFVLFTSIGAVSNTAITQVTGNIGTNTAGGLTWVGNVNGILDDNNGATGLCVTAVQNAYNQLTVTWATFGLPLPTLGNGEILAAGVDSLVGNGTLNGVLTLNGTSSDVFIIKIAGTFATNVSSRVVLTGGAVACNVYWLVQGLVTLNGDNMKGTIVSNAAININPGDTLEGRALTTAGAITVTGGAGVLLYTPIGCGSTLHRGPAAPILGSTACYTVFTTSGALKDIGGTSTSIGDVGNAGGGTVTGWIAANVTGTLHITGDPSTLLCAADLTPLYNYLNLLPYDIQLMYPTQLGNGLVLTPHTYWLNGPAILTDTLTLNAEGDANAVFVIQIVGALTESGTSTDVKLINGALAQNVYWIVNGAVTLNNFSVFRGTIISNAALVFNTGDTLYGRALSTAGAITSSASVFKMPPGCNNNPPLITVQPINQSVCAGDSVSIFVTATGAGLTYQWRKGNVNVVNGGNISGATTDTLTFNPVSILDNALNYNVVIIGTYPPSDTSINVSLMVNPPPVANAGPDKNICKGDSVTLGTPAIIGDTYSWSPSLWLNSSIVAQPNASPARDTTYILTVINTATGCKNTDTVNVTVNPALVANAGPNKIICKGDSTSIGTPVIIGDTYSWLPIAGLNSSIKAQPNASPAGTVTYTLTVSNGSCSDTSVVTVTVNSSIIANAGTDKNICKGDSTTIGTVAILGNTYSWSPSVGLNSSIIAQPKAGPSSTTVYIVTVTNGSCSNTDSVRVTVHPLPLANAGPNQYICDGGSVQLGGAAVAGDAYMWTPTTALNSSAISNPKANPDITTLYTLLETDTSAGCSTSSQVLVTVEPNQFYDGFSPNGDGINDFWDIPMLNCYPTNTVTIINRWGSEVWNGENYDNTSVKWTGENMNGENLPDGTYYYIIKYNNTEKRGWVFIKR